MPEGYLRDTREIQGLSWGRTVQELRLGIKAGEAPVPSVYEGDVSL
jgi:hypothetical protein